MSNKASAGPKGELAALARLARRRGWTIRRGGKHYIWTPPGGGSPVYTPGSPGEGRSHANTRALLRRAGLRLR